MGKEAGKETGVDLEGTDRRQPAEEVCWVVAVTTQRGIDRSMGGRRVHKDPWQWGSKLGQLPRMGKGEQAGPGETLLSLAERPRDFPEKRQTGGSEVLGPKAWLMLTLRSHRRQVYGGPILFTWHSQCSDRPALQSWRGNPRLAAPTPGPTTPVG